MRQIRNIALIRKLAPYLFNRISERYFDVLERDLVLTDSINESLEFILDTFGDDMNWCYPDPRSMLGRIYGEIYV